MPEASFSIPPPSPFHFLCSILPTPQKGNKGVKDRPTMVGTSEHNITVRVWLTFTPIIHLENVGKLFERYYSLESSEE
jgi:hypothetical protein